MSLEKFNNRIKYVKIHDIFHILLFIIALPCSCIFKLFHKDIWLFCEDKYEARDNAYWLFKYTRENHPEIDAVYAINPKCPDAEKVRKLGKAIKYGNLTHWIYYLASNKQISSQKGGKPNAAVCYFLEISGLWKNKRIFLQHGIIKDDLKWLYYDVCKFSLFVTSTKREFEFVENTFGYKNRNIVKLLGLCRFDNLMNYKNVLKQNQILVMPTWRDWLAKTIDRDSEFMETQYFKTWHSFLHNKELQNYLEENGYTLIFYPHRQMQKYISLFKSDCPSIIIPDFATVDVQKLLMESAFIITDYSSIYFDFAYMEKPLVYYQFDYKEYREKQYQEGYFSYENDGFGEICYDEQALIDKIKEYCSNQFKLKEEYKDRIKSFFTFHDDKNCERNFNAIGEL